MKRFHSRSCRYVVADVLQGVDRDGDGVLDRQELGALVQGKCPCTRVGAWAVPRDLMYNPPEYWVIG